MAFFGDGESGKLGENPLFLLYAKKGMGRSIELESLTHCSMFDLSHHSLS